MCHLCEKGKEGLGDQLTIAAIRSPDEGVETYPIGMAVLLSNSQGSGLSGSLAVQNRPLIAPAASLPFEDVAKRFF